MKTNLRIAREKANTKQAGLACAIGKPVRTYQRYEAGTREPGVRTAIRIADALNVTTLKEFRELFAPAPEAPISQKKDTMKDHE